MRARLERLLVPLRWLGALVVGAEDVRTAAGLLFATATFAVMFVVVAVAVGLGGGLAVRLFTLLH